MIDDDPYTAEARLCDDAGMVSDERVPPGQPGTATDPDLTYRRLLNNLRAHTGLPPYDGPDFQCTGNAHLAREHFRCTNPRHTAQPAPSDRADIMLEGEAAARAAEILVRRGTATGRRSS